MIRNDALSDVQEALPALRAAEEALGALNKSDIIEMKTFPKPPALVQLTMEGVCVLLGEKSDWDTARRVRSLNLQRITLSLQSSIGPLPART